MDVAYRPIVSLIIILEKEFAVVMGEDWVAQEFIFKLLSNALLLNQDTWHNFDSNLS